MLAAFLYGPTDGQTDRRTVADTNKGVVEVQAIRLRTNILTQAIIESDSVYIQLTTTQNEEYNKAVFLKFYQRPNNLLRVISKS